LRALQSELSALEIELADPSNPLLQAGNENDTIDPGELIRGLVDVRGRLEKIRKDKQGRGKLVSVVLGQHVHRGTQGIDESQLKPGGSSTAKFDDKGKQFDPLSIVTMDRRVGELEKLLGSSSVTLDEVYHTLYPPSQPLTVYKRRRYLHYHLPCSLSSPSSIFNSLYLHNPVTSILSLDASSYFSPTLTAHLPKTTHTDATLPNLHLRRLHKCRNNSCLYSLAWDLPSPTFLTC
jgi:hypothetical protein